MFISLARCIVEDETELHTKLRRDIDALTQAKDGSKGNIRLDIVKAVDLMELILQVKFAMFSTKNNLMEMVGSNPFTFFTCYSDEVGSLVQPLILTVTIVSSTHVHKTVVNAKSGTGAFIKGKDERPNWIITSASQHGNLEEGIV